MGLRLQVTCRIAVNDILKGLQRFVDISVRIVRVHIDHADLKKRLIRQAFRKLRQHASVYFKGTAVVACGKLLSGLKQLFFALRLWRPVKASHGR
jgi:hypothetical protein